MSYKKLTDEQKQLVYDDLLKKFSGEERQKIVDANKEASSGLNWRAGIAALGAGLAGQNAASAGMNIINAQEAQRQSKLDDFDNRKSQAIKEYFLQRDLDKESRDEDYRERKLQEDINYRNEIANQRAYDKNLKLEEKQRKEAEAKLPENRVKKLNGSDKARFDNALMVLKGIDEMGKALDADENTFSIIGDNNYTSAERRATEAYGRMQSGGAINKDEEERFRKTLPQYTDNKELQRKKLIDQRNEMISRLKTLGFSLDDIKQMSGYEPEEFQYGSSSNENKSSKSTFKTDEIEW